MWKRINLFFTVGVVVWRDDGHETTVKGNDNDGWSSDGLVLWLRSGQNRDVTEWWGEWPRLRWHFYSSRRWELGDPGRITGGGGTDSMLQFQLERKGDGMKHCRNMKWKQQARLGSMEKRHDTVRRWAWSQPEERRHWEGKKDDTMSVGITGILLCQKIKKIHAIDSAATNALQ
jgi:hypothetical protein